MDITFTVIAWTEAVGVVNRACKMLQSKVSPIFSARDFGAGVQDFIVVVVAVSEDNSENAKFYNAHTRSGYSTNAMTGEKTKTISIGVPLPALLSSIPDESRIAQWIVAALRGRVNAVKYPKEFEKDVFLSELLTACEAAISSG